MLEGVRANGEEDWRDFKGEETRERGGLVRSSRGRQRMRKRKISGTLGFYMEEQFLNKNGMPKCERNAVLLDIAG